MPFDTAQKAIDFLMYHSIDTPTVTIGFYGGEPLLEYKLIEEIVEYCKSKYFFRDINYTITTNGSLLTDNVSDFLYENHFQLLVSLDGPESVHNKNRFFQGKQGSYQTVINNLKHLLERHPDYTSSVNISAVIDTDNDFDIISDYFNKNDILKNIHTIFSKIDTSFSDAVRPSSKTYLLKERYHNFLSLLSGIGRIPAAYISPLSENIGILKKQIDSHCVCNSLPDKGLPSGPCIPGLIRLFVDTDGKFFPCERVSENSKSMNIGDLKAGFSYEYISHLFNIASITSEHCRNCWAFRHCTSCIKLADDHGQITMSKRLSYCNSIRARIDMEMRYKIFLQDINILKNVFNMNC